MTARIEDAAQDELKLVSMMWARANRMMHSGMPDRAYYGWMRDVVSRCLQRGPTVLVARDVDAPLLIYGFACGERVTDAAVVHYLYVKHSWRREGIGSVLLGVLLERIGGNRLVYTHRTRHADKAQELGFRFVPIEAILHGRAA